MDAFSAAYRATVPWAQPDKCRTVHFATYSANSTWRAEADAAGIIVEPEFDVERFVEMDAA